MSPQEVIRFWFEELKPKDWFAKSDSTDQLISARFLKVHQAATRCELWDWRSSPEGCLAEILVLDQFSRNIYRSKPESFASDALALALAQNAVLAKNDQSLSSAMKAFLYMPHMHSESKTIHIEAIRLFSQPGLEENLKFELRHKEIIEKFGRYPHRNKILGRVSTPEEIEFLKSPFSSF